MTGPATDTASDTATVHLVLLDFADRAKAPDHMDGHNAWIRQGFDDGAFLLTGTVPGRGGAVLFADPDRTAVDDRVAADPFVAHGVVTPHVVEIVPSQLSDAFSAALDASAADS